MCYLSETSKRRTISSTSHDELIMTAIAENNARARCNAMARCTAHFCELTDANFEAVEYFRAHERAMTD